MRATNDLTQEQTDKLIALGKREVERRFYSQRERAVDRFALRQLLHLQDNDSIGHLRRDIHDFRMSFTFDLRLELERVK